MKRKPRRKSYRLPERAFSEKEPVALLAATSANADGSTAELYNYCNDFYWIEYQWSCSCVPSDRPIDDVDRSIHISVILRSAAKYGFTKWKKGIFTEEGKNNDAGK